ncbi:MAG TPA: NADP-dependent phosphogluconate dehydrogenase, partial [Chloroflexota bacterium]|nr:NADP-dependent phosphogluconate dehydrogenase [Chloroflexota bacterium]
MAARYGLIGLAVMGENLTLNIEQHGFPIAVFNRTAERTRRFAEGAAKGKQITPTYSIPEFMEALERPRRIILMVQAGRAVDAVLDELRPYLEPGDVVVDGGNSLFVDTRRRCEEMSAAGINYFGMGVSGGEEGARWGPSIMPGGPREAYPELEPMLVKIAAQVEDGPCVAYIGPGGSGHYVKMVHNGIEYGDMQMICEAYALMKGLLGLKPAEMSEIFTEWNQGILDSFLIEITADILKQKDPATKKPFVDVVLDTAGQKGTGKWTSTNALDMGVPAPTIAEAVFARCISAIKEERVAASKILK